MEYVIDYMDNDPSHKNTDFRILYSNWTAGLDCFFKSKPDEPNCVGKMFKFMKHRPIN